MTATALSAAAFGEDPGMWPLPARAHTGRVVAARRRGRGQGHYSSAQADLSALLRQLPAGGLASLALSTRASFLRQLGGHRAARGWDGRALALAGTDGASTVEPAVDALVGLAADALGVGRLAASATLLERADAELARADVPPARLAIRRAWVGAELAMAAGDGARAQASAERGVELAERALPALRRHREERRGARRGTLQRGGHRPRPRGRRSGVDRHRRPMVWCRYGGRWPACCPTSEARHAQRTKW
jgi:hypothetical protein